MEFYKDDPLRTRLMPGAQGYIITSYKAWKPWRKWLPVPVRKTIAEKWPVTVGETTTEGSTYSVTFTPTTEA